MIKRKIVLIALLLAAAAGLWYTHPLKKQKTQNVSQENTAEKQIIGEAILAPSGELITGFPRDLVMDKKAVVSNSSLTPYEHNHKQYTTTYVTDRTVGQEYNSFLTYLEKNKYTITKKEQSDSIAAIYAQNQYGDVNVTLYKDVTNGKTTVVISYLLKK